MAEDLWNGCYDGTAQSAGVSPRDFERTFCQRCRNLDCTRSGLGLADWIQRMATQEDRLLTNPNFADPDDPKFDGLRALPFEDMLRQAMALEVTAQRGDWTIPTEEDITRAAQGMLGLTPTRFVPDGSEEPEPEPEVLWEGTVSGSKNRTYHIALAHLGQGDPRWTCTCPSFTLGNPGPEGCKHIREARVLYETTEPEEPEPPTRESEPGPSVTREVSATTLQQMQERNLLPRAQNTTFPSQGMMVDGSAPAPPEEPPDTWAIPESKRPETKKVEVGGTFTFGESPTEEESK